MQKCKYTKNVVLHLQIIFHQKLFVHLHTSFCCSWFVVLILPNIVYLHSEEGDYYKIGSAFVNHLHKICYKLLHSSKYSTSRLLKRKVNDIVNVNYLFLWMLFHIKQNKRELLISKIYPLFYYYIDGKASALPWPGFLLYFVSLNKYNVIGSNKNLNCYFSISLCFLLAIDLHSFVPYLG